MIDPAGSETQMSSRKRTVLAYFEGFRRRDHDAILTLLTEDVVWNIYGHRYVQGKQQFDGEIENDAFEGSPELILDHLVEEGETIVAPHLGTVKRSDGELFTFAACDVFTFDADLICRVESYVVPTDAQAKVVLHPNGH